MGALVVLLMAEAIFEAIGTAQKILKRRLMEHETVDVSAAPSFWLSTSLSKTFVADKAFSVVSDDISSFVKYF